MVTCWALHQLRASLKVRNWGWGNEIKCHAGRRTWVQSPGCMLVWFGLVFCLFYVRFCSFLVFFLIQTWQLPCTPNNNKMGSRNSESPKTPRSGSLAYQAKSKATKRSCLKHKDDPTTSEVFWLLQACTHMYMHSHVHNMCTCSHVHSLMCVHSCAVTCMCTHSYVHTFTCAHTHMRMHSHVYILVCTHSHMHTLTCDTCVHTHICIHSPTHTPKSPGLMGPNGPWSCDSQEPSRLCYSACYRVGNAVSDSAPAGPLSQTCLITRQPEETKFSRPPWALNCSIDNHLTDLESQEVGAGVPQLSQKHRARLLPHPS